MRYLRLRGNFMERMLSSSEWLAQGGRYRKRAMRHTPCFGFANRKESDMLVWLHLR